MSVHVTPRELRFQGTPSPGKVGVLAMPILDPGHDRTHFEVEPGTRILDMIDQLFAGLAEEDRPELRVYIGGHRIYPWCYRARPRVGTTVVIRVVPGNSGLRTALQVAILVAATVLAPGIGNAIAQPAIAAFGSVAGSVATAAVGAAIVGAGTLLLQQFAPESKEGKKSPSWAINGWRNREAPDQVVPIVLGFIRHAPAIAASSYTEIVGKDQYVRFLMTAGYGPLEASNWRIGETPIAEYKDVLLEIRDGYADDAPITLYPDQVVEDAFSIELCWFKEDPNEGYDGEQEPQVRVSQPDAFGLSVDVCMLGGVGYTDSEGRFASYNVTFTIEYRQVGAGAWSSLGTQRISGQTKDPIRRTYRWAVPTRGLYEVRVTRTKYNVQSPLYQDQLHWTALRTHRPEKPIAFEQPLQLIAGRIRASRQLNGTLDELNADFKTICPDWDVATQTWITRPTNNCASLARYVLQGPFNAYPRPDSRIDLPAFEDWHEFCVLHGLTFNAVIDFDISRDGLFDMVAAAGRAKRQPLGTLTSVVIDRPRTTIMAPIDPRNAWDIHWNQKYTRLPDAFRVTFKDETRNYETKERLIWRPGFVGVPLVFEDLDLPGATNPTQVYLRAYRHWLELLHRPDTMSAMQAWRHLDVSAGDLVALSHPMLDPAQRAGLVSHVAGAAIVLDEEVEMEEGKDYAVRFFRPDVGSWWRTVAWRAGSSRLLRLTGSGEGLPTPAKGDEAHFGTVSNTTRELIVSRITRMNHDTARIEMLRHAPEIDELLDEVEVPPWDGRAGGPAGPDEAEPAKPVLSIVSGVLAAEEGDTGTMINVSIAAGPGSAAIIDHFKLRHRLAGGGAWTVLTLAAGETDVRLAGYLTGDEVELAGAGVSTTSIEGAWSDTVTHEVGATDPTGAAAPGMPVAFTAVATGADVDIAWTAPNSAAMAASRIWRAPSGGDFTDATDVFGTIFGSANVSFTRTDTPGAGSWDYWVTAENADGDRSSPAGPETATTT